MSRRCIQPAVLVAAIIGFASTVQAAPPTSTPAAKSAAKQPVATTRPTTKVTSIAATKPATKPVEYFSIVDIFHAVPEEIYPPDGGHWTDLKISLANESLQKNVMGHPGTLTFHVKNARPDHEAHGEFLVTSGSMQLGQQVYWYWCRFDKQEQDALAKLTPGQPITIRGNIYGPTFQRREGGKVCFEILMERCKVLASGG